MKHPFLTGFLFLAFNLATAQESPIVLKTFTGDIEGTISVPDKKEPMPVVLIIAGSGPTDRNGNQGSAENNSLKMLAEEFNKVGVASLRFDKRGVAQSSDAGRDEMELRFDNYVDDATSWIELLSADKRFSKIIVAGHSEGSLIGMIASGKSKNVSAFISIAGAGRPADEIIKEQLQKAPDNVKASLFPMIDKVKKGDSIPSVPPIFYVFLRPSIQPYLTSWFRYDPRQEIAKLKQPALILQGNTDIQVKEADAELLHKAQPRSAMVIIKNMNHVLKNCEVADKESQKSIYNDPNLPLNTDFVKEITGFVLSLKK